MSGTPRRPAEWADLFAALSKGLRVVHAAVLGRPRAPR